METWYKMKLYIQQLNDPDTQTYQIQNYHVSSIMIGKGAFSKVFLGYMDNEKSKLIAVKIIPTEELSQKAKELLANEIKIMKQFNHINIVQLQHYEFIDKNMYLFQEFCNGGDLTEYINQGVQESTVRKFIRQILNAMHTMFLRKVVHRDLKPQNILFNDGVIKIADFGFARILQDDMEEENRYTILGTPFYMSPQILDNQPYSSKLDIWSLGVIFYQILYGKLPFEGRTKANILELQKNTIENGIQFPEFPQYSQDLLNLLQQMLIYDEKKRISWENVFHHEAIYFSEEMLKSMIKLIQEKYSINSQNNSFFDLKFSMKKYSTEVSETDEIESSSKVCSNEKIKQIHQFERQIGVIYNQAANQCFYFFQNYQNEQPQLCQKLIVAYFFLQKKQIIIYNNLINQIEQKQLIQNFNLEQCQNYYKCEFNIQFIAELRKDNQFISQFHENHLKQFKSYFKDEFNKDSQCQSCIDNYFSLNHLIYCKQFINSIQLQKQFLEKLSRIIDKFLKILNIKELQIVNKYLKICIDPKQKFNSKNQSEIFEFQQSIIN